MSWGVLRRVVGWWLGLWSRLGEAIGRLGSRLPRASVWSRVIALSGVGLIACIPSSRVPAVSPSRTLEIERAAGATAPAPFGVVFAAPRGQAGPGAAIELVFNRPMRELETAGEESVPRVALSPDVPGRWLWMGTSALVFRPSAGRLPGATAFQVEVPAGTRALDGSALAEPYRFAFETPRPELVRSEPYEGQDGVKPGEPIELFFNQPIALPELSRHLTLSAVRGDSRRTLRYQASYPDPASPKRVVLRPEQPLPVAHTIRVALSAELRGQEGPLPLGEPQQIQFETYGPLVLRNVGCSENPDGRCAPGSGWWLEFSNPVPIGAIQRALAVEPAVALRWYDGDAPDTPVTNLHVEGAFRAGQSYTLSLDGGLRDVYGQALGQVARRTLRVGDYQPSVRIGVVGDYLEPGLGAALPVDSVNVARYELTTARLEPQTALRLLNDNEGTAVSRLRQLGAKSATITPRAARNTAARELLDFAKLFGKADGRGPVAIATVYPDAEGQSVERFTVVQITDLAITAKLAAGRSLVWVTRLSTGAPIPGANVEIWRPSARGEPLRVTTDAQGFAVFDGAAVDGFREEPTLVVARAGQDWTYRRASDFIHPWRLDVPTEPFRRDVEDGLLFTERGIYRPGDVVKVKGIFRKQVDGGHEVVPGRSYTVLLRSPEYESVAQYAVKTNRFGAFALDVPVPRAAKLGRWSLVVEQKNHPGVYAGFDVAEYRPAEFKVSVQSAQPSYVRGDTARFQVNGDYLFGAPMSGAGLRYVASRHATSFVVPGAEGAVTGAEVYDAAFDERASRSSLLAHAEVKLDARGAFSLTEKLALPGQLGPELVTLDAEVTDVSRQALSGSSSVVVHPAEFYLALETPESYFVDAPGAFRPRLVAVTPSGQRLTGQAITLELIRRRWTLARQGSGDDVQTVSKVVDDVVGSCSFRTTAQASGCELSLPDGGYYVLLASAKDGRGNRARAAIDLYGIGPGSAWWKDSDEKQLELVLDKKAYRIGDTARILIKSPFTEADALVTVESGGVQREQRLRLRGATPTVSVPITDQLRPNAYVSVLLVRPRTQAPKGDGAPDLGKPTFRLGYAQLDVDGQSRRLNVQVLPAQRELQPGQELSLTLKVTDAERRPHPAELTVYAVDEGVLSLVDYRTPDPLETFTAPRPLGVATLESRDALARLLLGTPLLRGDGLDKGDAGGGGGEGGPAARRDFRQTAYYNPNVVTDAQGQATLRFRLPDSLTTFRVMAVATALDDRYGHGQASVVTSKRLMARPALPRALRAGDEFQASVIVTSKRLGAGPAQVQLVTSGLRARGPLTQVVELPRDSSVEVRFPVAAEVAGEAKLRFEVAAQGQRDAVEVIRTITAPTVLETVALGGQTRDVVGERLGELAAIRRDVGGLEVSVASSALVGIEQGAEQLVEYPYGCTEQLASKLLPLLPLRDLAVDYGFALPAQTPLLIDKTVAEILRRQRGDGGFAFWPESPNSSSWVSGYALWVLKQAEVRGARVPKAALEQGRAYLRRYLERPDEGAIGPATAALHVVVLAELGSPDGGYAAQLFERRRELPLFARALLLKALVKGKHQPGPSAELARELEQSVRVEGERAFAVENTGDAYALLMDSNTRTSAMVLDALLAWRADHPLAARLAKGLLAARQNGAWQSTQEAAFALLALDAYRRAQERQDPDFEATIWLGEKEWFEAAFRGKSTKAIVRRLPAAELRGGNLVLDKDGEGTLFYEARLQYARRELPTTALDRGFSVQKMLRSVDPAKLAEALRALPEASASVFRGSDLVLADLFVITPSPREYVVLDDPLPAGFEAVDAQLETTAGWLELPDSAAEASAGDCPGCGYHDRAHDRGVLPGWYRQELRDDRVLFFVDHMPAGIFHYRYLARATSLGQFVTPPTKAEEMYTPEVMGRTAAQRIEVR